MVLFRRLGGYGMKGSDRLELDNKEYKKPFKFFVMLALYLISAVLIVFSIFFYIKGMNETKGTGDYTQKSYKEYKLSGLDSIAVDSKGYLYCLASAIDKIVVYDTNANFKFTIELPHAKHGHSAMYMEEDILYVLSKEYPYTVYMYKYGEFIEKRPLQNVLVRDKLFGGSTKVAKYRTCIDKEGNNYDLGFSPLYPMVTKTPQHEKTQVFIKTSFFDFITMYPFPVWVVGLIGLILAIITKTIFRKSYTQINVKKGYDNGYKQ